MESSSPDTRIPQVSELTGTIAGRFVITKMLGSGGMGQVYLAQDTKLKRLVAIKRMAPRLQRDEGDRRRFLREAQQASALNHPNIASIYDVMEEDGEVFLIMEYVEGTPLRTLMHKDVGAEQFFNLAIQSMEALNAAHDKGILHGDIKPENIMLTPGGRVKILDFGVARRFSIGSTEATLTADTLTSSISGTPAYMAPEVLMQKPYDGRADLFSMGLVCYEMLGGQQPFETDSIAGTLASVLHKEPIPLKDLSPKISSPLSSVVQTLLEKDPSRRYSSARDVLIDLRRVQQGESPVFAQRVPADQRQTKQPRSSTKVALAIVLAMTVLAGVAFLLFLRRGSSQRPGNQAQRGPEKTITLVVLPFEAADNDAKLAAFGNGLVDTITAKLAQLSENHPLQVVSGSELRQKNVTGLAEARQEFGADTGLRIALQQSGDMVRVSYSLTDTRNATVVKAGALDAPVTDPFAIEDELTKGVATALGFSLRPEESRELGFHGTAIPEAYRYYTQARGYLEDAGKAASVDSAIILLGQALKADANYGRAEADLGSAYWSRYLATKDKTFIAKSRQACSKAIDLGNAGAAGHVCLGVIESGTGQYENAVDQFQRAVELEPANEDAYIGLGGAYERLGKPRDAEATYKKVIQLRPNYWRGYNVLGAFYLRQAQYDDAAQMFQSVIQHTPESFRGYANLGATYLYEGKYADAIKPLEQSLAIRPTADTYSNVGTAYYYLRRFKEAVRTYEKAVQLNDKDYSNWGNLAEAYYLDAESGKAKEAFRKAIELAKLDLAVNPNEPQLLKNLADYYVMLGDRTDALKYLNAALQQSKFDREALFKAGQVYNHLGETGPAIEWLSKALRAGYPVEMFRAAPDLDNLREDTRFRELLNPSSPGTNK